jgi:hypothetical protein
LFKGDFAPPITKKPLKIIVIKRRARDTRIVKKEGYIEVNSILSKKAGKTRIWQLIRE